MRFTVSLAKEIREFFSTAGAHWKGMALILVVLAMPVACLAFSPAVIRHLSDFDDLKKKVEHCERDHAAVMTKLAECYRNRKEDAALMEGYISAIRQELTELRKAITAK